MDPQQAAVYATAHDELRDLFREIARHGRVTAHELQHALLPFTAGDARRDLQELAEDMKRRQLSLDEPDFIRALWKKMYLSNVVYTTQQTSVNKARPTSADSSARGRRTTQDTDAAQAINIPLAHVIVSIKRRAQLKQFANYYTSRGISGADHLRAAHDGQATDRSTPRHLLHGRRKRQAAASAAAHAASITALRARTSARYDVVVSCYDKDAWCMRAHVMFSDVETATVATCSRLHCIMTIKELGAIIVGSRHFMGQVRARAGRQRDQREPGETEESETATDQGVKQVAQTFVAPSLAKDLAVTKLDDLGLRNIVAMGVGRGIVVATTERRAHCWKAFDARATTVVDTTSAVVPPATTKADSPEKARPAEPSIPVDVVEFLEDEGDCFGHVPLLKRPKTVSDVNDIRRVACGDRFAIGVSATSELYAWGSAPLGRGKAVPTRVPFFASAEVSTGIVVSRVVCGLHHVLLLASHGSVFAWGSNVHGQLGVSPQGNALDAAVHEPSEVKLPSLTLDIACGDHHSVVLTDKGAVFAWGNNWHGQLGLDPNTTETGTVFAPTKVNWWATRERHHGRQRHDSVSSVDDEELPSPDRRAHETSLGLNASSPAKNLPPRVYLLAAVGDTTAIVSEQGQVFVWGKCVPPGPFAGACGSVAKWTAQRVEIPDELQTSDQSDHHAADPHGASTLPSDPVWAGIAVANGLVVLTRYRASASATTAR